MKQVEAVVNAVCEIRNAKSFDEAVKLTKEEKAQVVEIVARGLMSGDVDFSQQARDKYDTYEKVKGYASGMVDNHVRKCLLLNGGQKYETKNPGSRAGSGDEVIKNLRALKSHPGLDAEQIAKIDEEIKKRISEIAATKKKQVVVDLDKIPEELREFLKLGA